MKQAYLRGNEMMALARKMWPLPRSISGPGLVQTLKLIKEELPNLEMREICSGTKVFDWTVPDEWEAIEAYIETPDGTKICDFSENNLHLVGYSVPVNSYMQLEELQLHLHSLPAQPDAIPYVTSYYKDQWGFALTHRQRESLMAGLYKVVVETKKFPGKLTFGELVLPGKTDKEVFFSTYVCHPAMANNELSGPVLATQIAKELGKARNYYTYRFVFIPETIGSLIYMSLNLPRMKRNILAGFVLTCVGDEREFSYVPSRSGISVADKIVLSVASKLDLNLKQYSWLDRGSDERQYCSPGADLPVCSIMRSKYGEYPEYHTSLDLLDTVVTARGLEESLEFYLAVISEIEAKRYPTASYVGEPQLGKRNLYPNTSIKGSFGNGRKLTDVLSLSDGTLSVEEMSRILDLELPELNDLLGVLEDHHLVDL